MEGFQHALLVLHAMCRSWPFCLISACTADFRGFEKSLATFAARTLALACLCMQHHACSMHSSGHASSGLDSRIVNFSNEAVLGEQHAGRTW